SSSCSSLLVLGYVEDHAYHRVVISVPHDALPILAMNSFPFFAVPSAEAFLEQTRAQIPDPATGKPDPARMAAVLAKYPSARAFRDWAASASWPDSWANTTYNGIHTFVFVAPDGHRQPLRWSLRPRAPLVAMDAA